MRIEDLVSNSFSHLYARIRWPHLEDAEALEEDAEVLEEDVVDSGGEEVGGEGEEDMEDLNCRHLFLSKLMPSMVRIRSIFGVGG